MPPPMMTITRGSPCGRQAGEASARAPFASRAGRRAVRVFPHGLVEVVVPPRTAQRHVDEFVRSQAAWIAEARRQLDELASKATSARGFVIEVAGRADATGSALSALVPKRDE